MFLLSAAKAVVFFGIFGRLVYLQINESKKYRSLSDKNRFREWKLAPQRGVIKDYFGKEIASNEKVILHSDKLTTRDFITIDDLLESTIFYINAKNPLMGGEVINISSGVPLSLEYLSNLLKDRASIILNKKINIEFKNLSNKKADNFFSISNQKAVDFGMTFNNSLLFEIDSMLLKYESWFGDFPAQ